MAEDKDMKTKEEASKEPAKEPVKESAKESSKETSREKKEEKKTEELEKEVESLKQKLSDEKGDYLRLMAEFETFRRRSSQEKLDMVSFAAADTIKGLLPVLDDCERAIELLKDSSDEAAKKGTSLIYDKLKAYLKTRGLEEIDARGKKFDTDFHEAVAQLPVEDAGKKGTVLEVVQAGYTLGGKILRYAKVVVGK